MKQPTGVNLQNTQTAYVFLYHKNKKTNKKLGRRSKQTFLQRRHAAAAAAKSLQLCLTLCDPVDGSPPCSPVPGILQARTLEWVAISFSIGWKWKVKVKSLSRVWLLATPWTAAYQAPPSMEFSRQEYWSRVPLPSPSKKTYRWPKSTCNDTQHPWLSEKGKSKLLWAWDSLVVQWLGLNAFIAVAWVQSLIRELRSHKLRGKRQNRTKNSNKNPKATTMRYHLTLVRMAII